MNEPNQQLIQWLEGNPVHNGTPPDGECCPDFSCCCPEMLWPKEKRLAFFNGDDATRHKMLLGALGAIMDYHEKRKVHIIG